MGSNSCKVIVPFGDSELVFWAQTLPKRKRSRIISKATGMSRSWDLRVGKLKK